MIEAPNMMCGEDHEQTTDLHPCRYDEDVHNDPTPKCKCCQSCQARCSDEI